ncbi:hypothetical protein JXB27_01490, partial [Candidatus Woesearchaeota archaeon]|nr:hypothetical protein [Candidatus Woesearchaeota archaeon]
FLNRKFNQDYGEKFEDYLEDMQVDLDFVEEMKNKPFYERRRDLDWRFVRFKYRNAFPKEIYYDLQTIENRIKYGELRSKLISALNEESIFYDKNR